MKLTYNAHTQSIIGIHMTATDFTSIVRRHSVRIMGRMERKEEQCQLYEARLIAFTSYMHVLESCVNHLAEHQLSLSSFFLLEIHLRMHTQT